MNTPSRPRLKSITAPPTGPAAAEPAAPTTAVGEPKGAARKGVRNSPNPQAGDGRYPVAWLTIRTPYGATPTARSTCLCGRDRRASGARMVLDLITDHTDHRDACPLRTPQEGRAAA